MLDNIANKVATALSFGGGEYFIWCTSFFTTFPSKTQSLITNSGKYAHYGEGLTGRNIRFGSLSDCVMAALSGFVNDEFTELVKFWTLKMFFKSLRSMLS